MNNPLEGIDYPLLREQKLALVEMERETRLQGELAEFESVASDELRNADALQGIINLLDQIQDFAVDSMGKDKEEVFGQAEPDRADPVKPQG